MARCGPTRTRPSQRRGIGDQSPRAQGATVPTRRRASGIQRPVRTVLADGRHPRPRRLQRHARPRWDHRPRADWRPRPNRRPGRVRHEDHRPGRERRGIESLSETRCVLHACFGGMTNAEDRMTKNLSKLNVIFRSAKERPFAERKATMDSQDTVLFWDRF